MGEATHGTHEFFRLRHRLFEYLVRRHGFTSIGFETGVVEGMTLDRFISTGEGDPVKLVSALQLWPWHSGEVVDLLRWMRAYNLNRQHARKLHFYGVDSGNGIVLGWPVIKDFLRVRDPVGYDLAVRAEALMNDPVRYKDRPAVEAAIAAVDARLQALSDPAREDMRHVLHTILQNNDFYFVQVVYEARDRHMAENVAWALRQDKGGGGIFLWAHNAHIDRDPDYYKRQGSNPALARAKPMGSYLSEQFGASYYAIGTEFGGGSFRVPERAADGTILRIRPIALDAAPAPSLASDLASAGRPLMFLDFRKPHPAAADRWMMAAALQQNYGGADPKTRSFTPIVPKLSYDAMIFVARSTPSEGLPQGESTQPH
jgi:erythromycin esterase